MQLVRTHALLGSAKQVDGKQPLRQWNVGVLEDRSDRHSELLTARRALPNTLANVRLGSGLRFQPEGLSDYATMRAFWTFRPTEFFKKLAGFVIVAEVLCYTLEIHGLAPIRLFFHKPMGLSSV